MSTHSSHPLSPNQLSAYCLDVAQRAKNASMQLVQMSGKQKNSWLKDAAELLIQSEAEILAANARDIEEGAAANLSPAMIDRLKLDSNRIAGIARGLEEVANLPDPVGEVIESSRRPNGLEVSRIRVPLGVVFFIYESRPNVTPDAAAVCVKSGNAVILRGGKEAAHSNQAIVEVLQKALFKNDFPADAIQLVSTADRDAIDHFLHLPELIDLAIPRGGEQLIRRVVEQARMPVIKHFTGNCHVYIDVDADENIAESVVINSKCSRVGVCNACESLVVHEAIAKSMIPRLGTTLTRYGVEVRGDEITRSIWPLAKPATESDFFAEYLAPIISIKVVKDLDAAIAHVNHYGSHHTDAIITTSLAAARKFVQQVDSAAVMVNASTRFNDGGELGLGAEIGISTDKFHARGPCGLKELTTYKFVCYGEGHVRN